jgi:outer membrane protein assembly factor BamB
MIFAADTIATALREGEQPVYAHFRPSDPSRESGTVSAVDPATGQIRWQHSTKGHLAGGGALATAGGLVFFTEVDGHLTALDAESGEVLWRYKVDRRALGSPMAFAVDGHQRIAVASIRGLTVFGLP